MATPRQYRLQGATLAGRYRVGISRPGSALVYEAVDEQTGAPVTIAIASARSPADRVRDADAIARLSAFAHPRVSRVLGAGDDDGLHFVIGDGQDGFYLDEELAAGPLAAGRILAIVAAVCDGVAALHARALTHGAIGTRAVLVGRPASAADVDVAPVKLAMPLLAIGEPAGTVADDVAACRALLATLLEADAIAPLRALADAPLADAGELARRARDTFATLAARERDAVGTRRVVGPAGPPPMSMPMPTNWSPPPPPRVFTYRR